MYTYALFSSVVPAMNLRQSLEVSLAISICNSDINVGPQQHPRRSATQILGVLVRPGANSANHSTVLLYKYVRMSRRKWTSKAAVRYSVTSD